jgi:DNA primase
VALGNVHLTPQLVQAVRDAADILAVAGEHTRLKKAGRRWSGLCPLHKEKTPSFTVDPVQGLFYCFGCGQGGDAIKLHMACTGEDFPGAIETLARRYGIPLPTVAAPRRGEAAGPDPERALVAAAELFRQELARSPVAQDYLARRRISPELVSRYGLGYAPDRWDFLVTTLAPRLSLGELETAGLVGRRESDQSPYDRFRHRLMFPIRDAAGRLVGFGGRTLGDDRAKYVNTPETERFVKGHVLYGLDAAKRAIREHGKVLLVEGYFDVIGAVASGVDWAVASMGTALTPEQTHLLARYADEVVVGYDGDEPGENASRRALGLLLAEGLGVRRVAFPGDHDPDSLRLAAGPEAVRAAVEAADDAVVREIDRLAVPDVHREPRLRARAAEAVVELLRPIRDAVLRHGYARLASDRLGIPADLLWQRLGVERKTLLARPPADTAAPAAGGRRQLLGTEEVVIQGLLESSGGERGLLPHPAAFLDATCRNIYAVLLALYEEGAALPPDPRTVQSRLATDPASVDLMARLLLDRPDTPQPGALADGLVRLRQRWLRQRQRELVREISEAQRKGDHQLAQRLADEKVALVRQLNSDPRGQVRQDGTP